MATAAKICREADLDDETLGRLVRLGLIPHVVNQRSGWTVFIGDALLLSRIAAAYTKLGAAAVDAAPLLLHLLSLPEDERHALVDRIALVKHVPASRVDWYVESEVPLFPGTQPEIYPLRKLIAVPK